MTTRMELKLEELKVHLDTKFEVQKQLISDLTKEICSSLFKNLEKFLRKN